jgi:glycerol-3-phosphate acyltransferase PlsY
MNFSLPHSPALSGKEWTWIVASYFIGCFTAGYYWTRWRTGQDIRALGSGTVGARNVGRVLGAGGFTITLLLDIAKGALVVAGAVQLGLTSEALVASIVAVVIGHTWPMQLRFHGGKGVAVSVGALLAWDPFIMLCLIAIFLPIVAVLRNFTLSGMLAFTVGPLAAFFCGLDKAEIAAMSCVAILVVTAHRKNIREEISRIVPHRSVKEAEMHKGPPDEV